jgi:hypothetical protein
VEPFFFVLGQPKSGTTWMQKALDAHPELLCRGEGKFMVFRREFSKAATKYSDVLSGHQKRLFGEEFFPPLSRAEFDRIYRYFIEQRLAGDGVADGVRRIGNKDPEHGLVIADLARMFPDAAFIHIVRDPRDVAVSTWHHMRRMEPGFVETIGGFEDFVLQTAREWAAYVRNVRKAATRGAFDYLEVRYESLHADPAGSLRRTLDFLGVGAAPRIVAACLDSAAFERASGGRPRGQADPNSFYRRGVVGDWGEHMASDLAGRLLDETEGLAEDLGYQ